MVPPSLHTELHYAQLMVQDLCKQEKYGVADKLSGHIYEAERWDAISMDVIRRLFREKSIYHDGGYVDMESHFARDGVCPSNAAEDFDPKIYQNFGGM